MCSCNHEAECTEEYLTAQSEIDPSHRTVSEGTSWRTPLDHSRSEQNICSPNCLASSTPKSQREYPLQVAPLAPLRTFARRPDLAEGVAIARRRLDFDDTMSDFDDTDTMDDTDISIIPIDEEKLRRALQRHPMASSSLHHSRPCIPISRGGTYELRRARPPQHPPPISRQYAPRMTRMTPCGKCLRM